MVDATASSRVRKPRDRRRKQILEAAERVFLKQGYEATSIQDIADAVGILKGSLYHYIGSKDDLLYEIIRDVHQDSLIRVTEAVEAATNPLERIRKFTTSLLAFQIENFGRIGIFFQDFRSLRPERRKVIVRQRDNHDELLRELIKQGKEAGLVCPDVDPRIASMAVLGMVNWSHQWFRPRTGLQAADVAEEFADVVVAGISCSPDTHAPGHRRMLALTLVQDADARPDSP